MKSVPRFLAGAFRRGVEGRPSGDLQRQGSKQCGGRGMRMEVFSVDSPVVVVEAPKRRVGASRSLPRTIEAVQRRELGLDVGEVFGGGFAREGSPMQKTSHTEGHIGEKGCQGHGICTVGELSNARHALEGEAVAPGIEDTMNKKRRPPVAREPIANDILSRTDVPLDFDVDRLLKNLREARKGSVAGPSGMTSEHLKPLLESGECSRLFGQPSLPGARCQKRF